MGAQQFIKTQVEPCSADLGIFGAGAQLDSVSVIFAALYPYLITPLSQHGLWVPIRYHPKLLSSVPHFFSVQ